MAKNLESLFGKNWKTTLAGLLGAIAVGLTPFIVTGEINWTALTIAVTVAVLGYLSRDAEKKEPRNDNHPGT